MGRKYFAAGLICLLLGFAFNAGPAVAAGKAAKPKIAAGKKAKVSAKVVWTPAALRELRRVPRFVRAMVKAKINAYAVKHNIKVITPKIYNSIHI